MKGGTVQRCRWLVVAAALALIGVLVALPLPDHSGAAGLTPDAAAPPVASPTAAGLPSLAALWPASRPATFPGLPEGSAFRPVLALSPAVTVAVAGSPDGTRSSLVVLTAAGAPRVVQTATNGLFQGVVLASGRLFWMLTAASAGAAAGGPTGVGLWSAALGGGPAGLLTTDVGLPLLPGSGYDMQVIAGRLYWTAVLPSGDPTAPPHGPTQLRSIVVTGGPVQTRTIPGVWTMAAWPWLVAPPDVDVPPARYNVDRAVPEAPAVPTGYRQETCGSAWCLASGDSGVALLRPDGSDPWPAGVAGTRPVTPQVALRDRYVPLLEPAPAGQRLVLYDLAARRSALVAPAAGQAGTDGRYLWWSAGDREALTWYGLDLTRLP